MNLVPLTSGAFALVDAEDLLQLSEHCWFLLPGGGAHRYAATKVDGKNVLMHRLLMNAPSTRSVDHINGDGLDNRRSNLRLATTSENQANRRNQVGSSSQFKGIRKLNARYVNKPWRASITVRGVVHDLGTFAIETEAARAYDTAAKQYFGPFARLNFPEEQQSVTPPEMCISSHEVPPCLSVNPKSISIKA